MGQSIEKLIFVKTLMAAPIPDDEGDGGSIMGSGIGARNLCHWEWSRFSDCVENSEKDLQKFEGPACAESSRVDRDLNLRITLPSGSSIIWSISLRSIWTDCWGS